MPLVILLAGWAAMALGGLWLLAGLQRRRGVLTGLLIGAALAIPETLMALRAQAQAAPAQEAVLGAALALLVLVPGVVALARPLRTGPVRLGRDLGVFLLTGLILALLYLSGPPARGGGFLLLWVLVVWQAWCAWRPVNPPMDALALPAPPVGLALAGGLGLLGAGGWLASGALLALPLPDGARGLMLGAGMVAPELALMALAVWRGKGGVALGLGISAALFNLLGVLGVLALVTALPPAPAVADYVLPLLMAAGVVLAVVLFTRPGLGRGGATLLLAGYAAALALA